MQMPWRASTFRQALCWHVPLLVVLSLVTAFLISQFEGFSTTRFTANILMAVALFGAQAAASLWSFTSWRVRWGAFAVWLACTLVLLGQFAVLGKFTWGRELGAPVVASIYA